MSSRISFAIYWLVLLSVGCGDLASRSSHDEFNWMSEEYFADPLVIKLCDAIEANDIEEIEQLVNAGANVNAKGKGNMTPLLWAFPDNKLTRFKKLLELGADPNVVVTSHFKTKTLGIRPGNSVTLLATKTEFPGYFEAVFENGGNPNIEDKDPMSAGDTPIFLTIRRGRNKLRRIKTLIGKGANINHVNGNVATPMTQAISWGGQYDVVRFLLNQGADFKIFNNDNVRLIHMIVVERNRRERFWTKQQRSDYESVVEFLELNGESLDEAQEDLDLWDSWEGDPIQKKQRIKKVILERDAKKANSDSTSQ